MWTTTVMSPGTTSKRSSSRSRSSSIRSSVRSAKAASPLSWRAVKLSDSSRPKASGRGYSAELRLRREPARRGGADATDLGAGAVELLVGHHRGALEGQVAVDLDPGAAAVVLVADPDRDRARDAVDPQQQDVQRVAPLPVEPLLGVVGGPDVEGREAVDDARVGDRDVVGDLGPGAQADAVGLGDAAVLDQRPRRRLLVGPDTLLEGAAQLGVVGLADQVVLLVVEGRVEEEALVLELEVLVLLADPALAQGQQLLALGERAHRYGPFLESDRHLKSYLEKVR